MLITNKKPKEYDVLKKHFPELDFDKHVITINGVIHSKYPMPPNVLVHEMIHVMQQRQVPSEDDFLEHFINDPKFRLGCEVEAYNAEYAFLKHGFVSKDYLQEKLRDMCNILSGPLYGNIISYSEALKLITKE